MDISCLRPIALPSSTNSGLLLGVRISCLARLQLFWWWIHSDFQNKKILNWYGDLPRPRSRCASCSPSLSCYKSCVRCNSGQWFSLLFIFSRSKDPFVNYFFIDIWMLPQIGIVLLLLLLWMLFWNVAQVELVNKASEAFLKTDERILKLKVSLSVKGQI